MAPVADGQSADESSATSGSGSTTSGRASRGAAGKLKGGAKPRELASLEPYLASGPGSAPPSSRLACASAGPRTASSARLTKKQLDQQRDLLARLKAREVNDDATTSGADSDRPAAARGARNARKRAAASSCGTGSERKSSKKSKAAAADHTSNGEDTMTPAPAAPAPAPTGRLSAGRTRLGTADFKLPPVPSLGAVGTGSGLSPAAFPPQSLAPAAPGAMSAGLQQYMEAFVQRHMEAFMQRRAAAQRDEEQRRAQLALAPAVQAREQQRDMELHLQAQKEAAHRAHREALLKIDRQHHGGRADTCYGPPAGMRQPQLLAMGGGGGGVSGRALEERMALVQSLQHNCQLVSQQGLLRSQMMQELDAQAAVARLLHAQKKMSVLETHHAQHTAAMQMQQTFLFAS